MRHFGKLLSHDICGSDLKLHFENGEGLVQVVTADIIRVFSQLEAQPTFSKAIEGDPRKETAFSVEVQENGLLVLQPESFSVNGKAMETEAVPQAILALLNTGVNIVLQSGGIDYSGLIFTDGAIVLQ